VCGVDNKGPQIAIETVGVEHGYATE